MLASLTACSRQAGPGERCTEQVTPTRDDKRRYLESHSHGSNFHREWDNFNTLFQKTTLPYIIPQLDSRSGERLVTRGHHAAESDGRLNLANQELRIMPPQPKSRMHSQSYGVCR